MKHLIVINKLYDIHTCDTCGTTCATGWDVTINGVKFNEYVPRAHCYDEVNFRLDTVLSDILASVGNLVDVTFIIDGADDK